MRPFRERWIAFTFLRAHSDVLSVGNLSTSILTVANYSKRIYTKILTETCVAVGVRPRRVTNCHLVQAVSFRPTIYTVLFGILPKQSVVIDLFKDVEFATNGCIQDFASILLESLAGHAVA